ncbi:MAG: bifunctional [glutamate--ammonia ligase]-adenylyl-L-tyrosine phosphorylase/[glutamate--ammonia-ligase] adenylyltransferase [Pseudomonadota bacterium]
MWPDVCAWRPNVADTPPEKLAEHSERCLQQLQQALPGALHARVDELVPVWLSSPWAVRLVTAQPDLLGELDEDDWRAPRGDYRPLFGEIEARQLEEAEVMSALRRLRQREMLRIAIRDLMGWAVLEETLTDLTRFADAAIAFALNWSGERLQKRYGVPRDGDGREQQLIVYGMGKLGGGELNFSSDIDLIFFYPRKGETDGEKCLDNHQYFIRLGQQVIKLLDDPTGDGFVYRVDMRLRPFGDAGALAVSFAGAENYYQTQGREWERYALIKARPLSGDEGDVENLQKMLRPFVFRRYLDFTAVQSLRDLKAMIEAQVARKGMEDNIKLGRGGIREVEFIGQAFQLIYGGRNPDLRVRSIIDVLQTLAAEELLAAEDIDALLKAYTFLRLAENRLQMVDDGQTHDLPRDDVGRLRLAYAMGFDDWAAFASELDAHRDVVAEQFALTFAAPEEEDDRNRWMKLWYAELSTEEALQALCLAGDPRGTEVTARLKQLRESSAYQKSTVESRQRVDEFMAKLLCQVSNLEHNRVQALLRLINFVRAVARRSVYLVLLSENPRALERLVFFFAESEWVAEQLTRQPAVLDQLLDARLLYELRRRPELDEQLKQHLASVAEDNFEGVLNELRRFKNAYTLNVAAVDLSGEMPLMHVSDHLTECAEVLLQEAHRLAWRETTTKHGTPRCWRDGVEHRPELGVIGYGKLGGIELGYSSDLDVVFVHDSGGERQYTSGRDDSDKGVVDNSLFFSRTAQKLVSVMTAQTPAGQLYEIDTRLRPDGDAGALVKSMEGYREYLLERAWTWERQALVRARFICGSPALREQFDRVRNEVLCQPREREALRREVVEMREKMRDHLGGQRGMVSLKQDHGGLADIEFMVQYGVLGWAAEHPQLTRHSDNIRILESMADCGVLPSDEVDTLIESYRAIRAKIHRLALDSRKAIVESPGDLGPVLEQVAAIWQRWMLAGENG